MNAADVNMQRHVWAAPARWGFCLLIVLCVHGAATLWLLGLKPVRIGEVTSPPAVLLDLAPEPVAPPPEPTPLAPEPEQQAAQPPELVPDIPPPPPEPAPTPEVALPAPPPRPVAKVRPPPPRPIVRHEPASVAAPSSPPVQAAPAPVRAAPAQSQVSARWESTVAAYIARFKHYPVTAQRRGDEGVALMRFVVDRAGNVSSVTLVRSSGHADLDQEAQSWIQRAQPLPAPPPEIAQSRIELVIPLRFALH